MTSVAAIEPALRTDEGGTVRVGHTRVTLRSVVYAFNEGASAEEIVLRYPSLDLTDTYAAITHYLRHRAEIDSKLAEEDAESEELAVEVERLRPTDELRRRLRAAMAASASAPR